MPDADQLGEGITAYRSSSVWNDMLTEQQIQEIHREALRYPLKRAAAAEALKVVQRACGWVSDEHLCEAAALLDMTPAEMDSIATFYSLIYRRPVGRHVILICDSVSCYVMGYESLRDALLARLGIERLGQTSPDGRFTLLPVPCLGACDLAPAILIDQDLHGPVEATRLDEILERYE